MLSKSFKAGKCKTSLKLAVARIKLLKNKRDVQVKQMRRDLAQLLESGQDQTARIRVEHVIREEKTMSAYDLIELYCELIVARLAIIESQKNCPIDLKEAISSVIFASPRCADIPELLDVRKHFVAKYGKEFTTSALELRPDCGVSRLIVEKLSAKAPDIETKMKVLTAIAQEHNIKWDLNAFEEQVQKPPEDLLNGPNSFTSKMPMESSTAQYPAPPDQKHKPATKPNEHDMDRSSAGSNFFSPTSAETASQPGQRARGATYDVDESGHFYSREEVASLNRQKWTMEFKDATSAAQAAAESAERASMAARAAAELSSRANDAEYSSRSHEPSAYGSRHEHGNFMGSKLQGESLSRQSIKRDHSINEATYATNMNIQNGREAEGVQDRITRDSKILNEGSETARSQHSRIVSSPSIDSSSETDNAKVNQRHRKIEKDDFPSEDSAEKHPSRSVSSGSRQQDVEVSFSRKQKLDSYTPESFLKEDPLNQNARNERTDITDLGQGGMERKSSKSSSSQSSISSVDHETVWDLPVHKNSVSQHTMFGAGQDINQGPPKHGFHDDASVVYDQSDSDSDDHLEIDRFMGKHDLDKDLQHPQADIHTSSSKMEYSVGDQEKRFNVKDDSNSLLHAVSRVQPAEFSSMVSDDKDTPSQTDAATYDVSDRASSDSEDEIFTDRGETALNSLQHKRNVGKHEHPQSSSMASLEDVESVERVDQVSSSHTAKDTESRLSSVGGHELKFGRLTGGLRNKGYVRPPYLRQPMVDESPPLEISADNPSEKPMASPRDMTGRSRDVNEDRQNRKPRLKKNEVSMSRTQNSHDSDYAEAENLEQYSVVASSMSKLGDSPSVDDKQKISSTLMRPDRSEDDQGTSYERSVERASKESRWTSAAAFPEKNTEKQPLSPARRQHPKVATASILSNREPDDAKTAIIDTSRISRYTDHSDKKSSVKNYKSSIPTAIPFFEEENDEDEVLQPRHTVGSLRTREGRQSQRTRGSKVGQVSNFSSSPRESETHDRESKPSQSSRSEPERPSKPSISSVKPENTVKSKFLPPTLSTEPHPAQLSGTEALEQKHGSEASKGSLSNSILPQGVGARAGLPASNENNKQSALAWGSTSRENSLKGSHVHPKLPDYETLAAHFHSLRSNKR